MHQHCGDEGRASAHFLARLRKRNTLTIGKFVVLVNTFATTWIIQDVDALAILAQFQPQSQLGNLRSNYIWASYQHWACNLLVNGDLCGAQNPLIFTLGVSDSLRITPGNGEYRLHR